MECVGIGACMLHVALSVQASCQTLRGQQHLIGACDVLNDSPFVKKSKTFWCQANIKRGLAWQAGFAGLALVTPLPGGIGTLPANGFNYVSGGNSRRLDRMGVAWEGGQKLGSAFTANEFTFPFLHRFTLLILQLKYLPGGTCLISIHQGQQQVNMARVLYLAALCSLTCVTLVWIFKGRPSGCSADRP
eukprot:scaffold90277_cov16-Tisochrysis_lutea.AAC.4